jgi:puromycin-sensitive aminopeptidase
MPEVSCAHIPGGKKKVIFDISPKMSTYLLAWAIGEFDFVQAVTKGGVALRVFCPPGRAHQGT